MIMIDGLGTVNLCVERNNPTTLCIYRWVLINYRYEKMISGMYMGEIVRLVLVKLCKHGLIFGGRGSEELKSRGRFYTKYVSEVER